MSKTPRTDENEYDIGSFSDEIISVVPSKVCRDLEQDLQATKERAEKYADNIKWLNQDRNNKVKQLSRAVELLEDCIGDLSHDEAIVVLKQTEQFLEEVNQ